MKQKLWLTLATCLAYCIDKELYKAVDYLRGQARVLLEHQEKENKRILLSNSQRTRVAAKAKRLSRKMLEQCTSCLPRTQLCDGIGNSLLKNTMDCRIVLMLVDHGFLKR